MKSKYFNIILILIILFNIIINSVHALYCGVERFNNKLLEGEIKVALNITGLRNRKKYDLIDCNSEYTKENEHSIGCRLNTRKDVFLCNDYIYFIFYDNNFNKSDHLTNDCKCKDAKEATLNIMEKNPVNLVNYPSLEDRLFGKLNVLDLNEQQQPKLDFTYVFNGDKECSLTLSIKSIVYRDCVKRISNKAKKIFFYGVWLILIPLILSSPFLNSSRTN